MITARLPRLAMLILLLACTAGHAAVRITVNTTKDDFGSDNSTCSLREALYAMSTMQAFGGCALGTGSFFNSIALPRGTLVMSLPPTGNVAAGGAFLLNTSIILQGAGAGQTIVDAQSIAPVFVVKPGAGITTGVIDLTIRGGRGTDTGGAGIDHRNGKLSLQRVVVTDNAGFGIYSSEAEGLQLSSVTVSNNTNTGVYIYNSQTSSSTNSIVNTTVSGNVSPLATGGMALYASSQTDVTTISNSTIAFNTGRATDTTFTSTPAGVSFYGPQLTVYLRNTILARNMMGSRALQDCAISQASVISQGYNLIEHGDVCGLLGDTAHDIVGLTPQLAPLWDYGGGIPTHAVYPATLALNNGNPAAPGSGGAACETTDARGVDRTQNTPCDIGAYEYHADFRVNDTADGNDKNSGDGICLTQTNSCTLRAAIEETNVATTFKTIELPAGHYTMSIPRDPVFPGAADGDFNFQSGFPVTVVGVGADQTVIDGGQYDRILDMQSAPLAIHGTSLQNGVAGAPGDTGGGGAISVTVGDLLLDADRVTNNAAYYGNGVLVAAGASARIVDSSIDNNAARAATSPVEGGGGVDVRTGATLSLFNSTIADNYTGGAGGGIYNAGGTVSIDFSTIADNRQANNLPHGAGVAGTSGVWKMSHSIIAGNLEAGPSGGDYAEADCAASLQTATRSFVQSLANCTVTQPSLVSSGFDPLLAPLLSQDGTTPTIAPLAASALLTLTPSKKDCVDTNGNQLVADQRGIDRPDFYHWQTNGSCVIGAMQDVSIDDIFNNGFQ